MQDIAVFAAGYYRDDAILKPLLRSAERVGVEITVFGKGLKWPGYVGAKLRDFADVVEMSDAEVILYVDGADTIFVHGSGQIMEDFRASGASLLFAADRQCYPHVQLKQFFKDRFHCRYPHICAGGFIGYRSKLITALDAMAQNIEGYCAKYNLVGAHANDDQGMWQIALVEGDVEYDIDTKQRIFASVANTRAAWYEVQEGDFIVKHGGARPHIVHLGGYLGRRMQPVVFQQLTGEEI